MQPSSGPRDDVDDPFPEEFELAPWELGSPAPADTTAAARDLVARYRAGRIADDAPAEYTNRFYRALTFNVPFLLKNLPVRPRRVLEIGCSKGAKGFPFSVLADEYLGVDISPGHIRDARDIANRLGATNTTFEVVEAAKVSDELLADDRRFDLVILYAVIEHLTIDEKLGLLGALWRSLSTDGVVYIGEAPNRMFPIDYHSTKALYFQQMPLDLWPHLIPAVPSERWRKMATTALESGDWPLAAYRRGLHVGHQEFDLTMMPVEHLPNHTLADSFDAAILNLYPFTWFEFLKLAELRSLATMPAGSQIESRQFPDFFSRYYLEVLLQKDPRPEPRPSATVTWPAISDSDSLFARDRSCRITHDAPLTYHAAGAGPEIAVTIQIQGAGRAPAVNVTAADGTELHRFHPRTIVTGFARRRSNVCVGLPRIPASAFPISIAPVRGPRPLEISAVFETA